MKRLDVLKLSLAISVIYHAIALVVSPAMSLKDALAGVVVLTVLNFLGIGAAVEGITRRALREQLDSNQRGQNT